MNFDDNNDKTHTHIVLTKGTMVNHYRIVEKIGAGGMGEVYLAEDTKLDRRVALKFLPTALISDENVRARFVREAKTVAKLNHPNIVSVYEVSDFKGRPFYVMELVEGESLRKFTHGKTLPFDTLAEYAIQICQGLAEAHRAGIVHRDIKPENIVVDTQGRIRLLDFGVAAVEGGDKLTKSGSTLGTVSYMSPEQVSGRDIDHRSDLFSVGIVLYELITGQSPFRRDNEGATLKAIIEDNPEPLTRYKSDVPEKLQQIVSELLEKDREIRFQSAEGVIAALKRLTYDSQQSGYRSSEPKQKKTGVLAGVSGLALVAVILIVYMLMSHDAPQSPEVDAEPLIAVLPFDNLGPAEDDYFADGVTEEITSRLAGIEGLGVLSPSSASILDSSSRSLKEIGSELDLDYVLQGTVRWDRSGDNVRVRITPQLIRVNDDRHLWGDNYERDLKDIFVVQADIASRIVEQLGISLGDSTKTRLADIPTDNPEAYQLYLKALNFMRRSSGYHARDTARMLLDSVVEIDTMFALAFALRAEAYGSSALLGPDSKNGRTALESATRAIELEPDLPQAHLALGYYYSSVDVDYDRALKYLTNAYSEIQNDPELLHRLGSLYRFLGREEEALKYRLRAAELDPLNPRRHSLLVGPLNHLRRFAEAESAIDRAIALSPDFLNYYEQKMFVRACRFGEIDSVTSVIRDALEYCDTIAVVLGNSRECRWIPELRSDSIISAYIETYKADTTQDRFLATFASTGIEEIYLLARIPDEALREAEMKAESEHWKHWAGLLYSFVGECEKAISLGLQEKDIAANPECAP